MQIKFNIKENSDYAQRRLDLQNMLKEAEKLGWAVEAIPS